MQKNFLKFPVEFPSDLFGEGDTLARTITGASAAEKPRVLIVADYNVVTRTPGLGTKIGRYVKEHSLELAGTSIVMGGGEKIKSDNLQSVCRVLNAMTEAKLASEDVVLAIGGGTILDVAGYAAAQFRGGVRLVRVPTTPAAMFDAAFAEYAAVDFLEGKDALRVPCIPAAVLIDAAFATTVLDGVWRAGFGEAVRLAFVNDPGSLPKLGELAAAYFERKPDALAAAIKIVHSIRSRRGATDFALALASRLEEMSGWKMPHGYAVAIAAVTAIADSLQSDSQEAKTAAQALKTSGSLDGLDHSRALLERNGCDFGRIQAMLR